LDEADAMYRTEDRTQKMEQAYDLLMAMDPCLSVLITATPVPVLLVLKEQKIDADFISIQASHDYFGVEDMIPLCDDDGSSIFLKPRKLNAKDGLQFDDNELSNLEFLGNSSDLFEEDEPARKMGPRPQGGFIPYTDDACKRLYDDAFTDSATAKGILVLDITNPRVYADGNVFQKAAWSTS
jgi:hypothetical protein